MSAVLAGRLTTELAALAASDRLRVLSSRSNAAGAVLRLGGRDYINFTSNDYLGLAAHPRILARVRDELGQHGFGSGSAALLGGRSCLHAELERELAEWLDVERALLFSSGYLANLGALGALIAHGDSVIHDRLNHASLIDAVLASGAAHQRYAHGNVSAAARRLATAQCGQAWCVTESLFSMDGDCAPLADLAALCQTRAATLYIDDAHGLGVIGDGRGASGLLSADARRACLFMVTLGKSLGSLGAAVLGCELVIEYLVQRARTFIYDTALPPVCAAAALEALAMLREDPGLPARLASKVAHFRERAAAAGLPLSASSSAIQPLVLGTDARAVAVAAALAAEGYYVRAIRPPTVPSGTARLRITLTTAHTAAHIEGLVDALARVLSA